MPRLDCPSVSAETLNPKDPLMDPLEELPGTRGPGAEASERRRGPGPGCLRRGGSPEKRNGLGFRVEGLV